MAETRMAPEQGMPAQPGIADEFKRMEAEYEPLLPVEKKLIGFTFASGLVLLVVLIVVSRLWF
jgi:hypothetical protein